MIERPEVDIFRDRHLPAIGPHAEALDYDDSGWRELAPAETQLRLSQGRVCFNWYRIAITIPERIGDFNPAGSTVVFEVAIDDYAEIWVNGELPHALGDTGGAVVGGGYATAITAGVSLPLRGAVTATRWTAECPPDQLVVGISAQAGTACDRARQARDGDAFGPARAPGPVRRLRARKPSVALPVMPCRWMGH